MGTVSQPSSSSACSPSCSNQSINAATTSGSQNNLRSFMFTDQATKEEFMKTLECPICLESVVPPVVNCSSGHIICSICRQRVEKCGLCGSPYTNIRNYPIEAILALLEARCRNTLCSQTMKADRLREHLLTCEYRPIMCQEYSVVKCNGRLINFEDYPTHLMEVHKTRCKTSDDPIFQRINLSNALEVKWPIFLLSHRKKTFFLHRRSVSHNLLCWVTMMGTEKEADNYSFLLRIRHPYHEDKSMEWNIRAHSVHTVLGAVRNTGDCAFIPYEALTPYCERKVMHTAGQIFEFKWTMTIWIKSRSANTCSDTNGVADPDESDLSLINYGLENEDRESEPKDGHDNEGGEEHDDEESFMETTENSSSSFSFHASYIPQYK